MLSVAGLSGCSSDGEVPGRPTSSQAAPSGSGTSIGLPHSGAPKVTKPIDASRYEHEPCSVVSQEQLLTLGIKIRLATPDAGDPTGRTCNWAMQRGEGAFSGAVLAKNGEGLSSLYYKNEDGGLAFFEAISSLGGYPAVVYDIVDGRSTGRCNAEVGLRDDLSYIMTAVAGTESPYRKTPCELAEKLAGLAVQTMKGGT